jgi:hypothetical protein
VTVADSRIDELRRRLERDPGSRLFAQLAEELRKAGEVEEAVGVARAGLERHPSYASARLTLGRALLDSGDPGGAKGELEAAVREAPDNILANRLLGEALERLGDLGGALARYRGTLEMVPGDAHVEARVQAIRARLGGTGPSGAPKPAGRPEVTNPMPAVRVGGAAGGTTPQAGKLPPTVRIRMHGGGTPAQRAPLPPTEGSARRGRPAGVQGVETEATPAGGPPDRTSLEPPPPTLPLGARTSEFRPGEKTGAHGAAEGESAGERSSVPRKGTGTTEVEGTARELSGARARGAEPTGGDSDHVPLSSATLGELYFQQGLLGRAKEVDRTVLDEDPGNDAARQRLAEIARALEASSAERPAPGPGADDSRAVRRRALEREIERLEALLLVVRRAR